MIVESMTHAEVYNELARDLPNLEKWMDRQYNDCRQYALKQDRRKFPLVLVNNYTSPRRIQYGLVVALFSKKKFIHYAYIMRQTPTGKEVYLCKTYDDSKLPKAVFIPHALKRYAERTGKDRTGEDLVRSMLLHSIDCVASRDQQIGAKSVRYKGDMLTTLCTHEGAFLGKMEGDIFVLNTFITYDMMGGLQKEVLTPHLEAFKRGHDAADELILKFNNRKSLRTNQPIIKQNGKRTNTERPLVGGGG